MLFLGLDSFRNGVDLRLRKERRFLKATKNPLGIDTSLLGALDFRCIDSGLNLGMSQQTRLLLIGRPLE